MRRKEEMKTIVSVIPIPYSLFPITYSLLPNYRLPIWFLTHRTENPKFLFIKSKTSSLQE